ncbi:MAG: (Fe-S)-binding protein [Deltaproteobacteria bacterium]|nr:(Fe-S)-binding protein [Deltaproteobacteria bacterium]MBW1934611.1 (Fe-S)-binding protein [Deltaproteobacteria bacterium]MBW1977927.1 (Fe-S)-binding protein [Deltaproteobacteria bacterium]MBW2046582.1 (Fe-S)-binding protein [Deltaproteobacteria bacterium]MBW2299556.1 (Fe-S)-binding protein [Deltaproteobacteria bacterium]
MNIVQLRKLSYDEVAKCNKCGFCLPSCPTYLVMKEEAYSPRGRNAITRFAIENKLKLSEDTERSIFSCLGCGACTAVCLSSVKTKDIIFQNRECEVDEGFYPKIIDRLVRTLEGSRNISDDDNEDRAEWLELIKDFPEDAFEKEHAEILFFVGCVASFFPMVQRIPANMAKILQNAGVDFTILGGDEWCCGFPLIGAGMPEKLEQMKEHNLKKVADVGAKTVVFTCPSCYHTWKHFYKTDVRLMHASQLIAELIKDKRLTLKKEVNLTATYHDPCDLGRNSGVFEEPREVVKAVPGLNFVELPQNRMLSVCCGGGGNVEMTDPDLTAQVAQMKLDSIKDVGAQMVVTACQQCVRTMQTRAKRTKSDLVVKDLTDLVVEAME